MSARTRGFYWVQRDKGTPEMARWTGKAWYFAEEGGGPFPETEDVVQMGHAVNWDSGCWRSVEKESPPFDEFVIVWYRGKPAIGKCAEHPPSPGVHDWIVFPAGACPVAPYRRFYPRWWMPMLAAPEQSPEPLELELAGEQIIRWRGSVGDLYTDLFPLLTPPQLGELARKLLGKEGGVVERLSRVPGCTHCESPDGHCPWHRPEAWKREQQVRWRGDLSVLCSDLRDVLQPSALLELARWLSGDTFGKPEPVPMLLRCPCCGERHIDVGEWATRPHHTHACQVCGENWRPAIVPTVGVHFLPGFKNSPPEESGSTT